LGYFGDNSTRLQNAILGFFSYYLIEVRWNLEEFAPFRFWSRAGFILRKISHQFPSERSVSSSVDTPRRNSYLECVYRLFTQLFSYNISILNSLHWALSSLGFLFIAVRKLGILPLSSRTAARNFTIALSASGNVRVGEENFPIPQNVKVINRPFFKAKPFIIAQKLNFLFINAEKILSFLYVSAL